MIRPFQNADTPRLVELVTAHFDRLGFEPTLTIDAIESRILGHPRFSRDDLLVCVDADRDTNRVTGFLRMVGRRAALVVIDPAEPIDDTLGELFAAATVDSVGAGVDACAELAGLIPPGVPIGVIDGDPVTRWLGSNGYRVDRRTTLYQTTTAGFRMPVNRQLLAIKRTQRMRAEPIAVADDPDVAWAYVHLSSTRLTLESDPQTTLASVHLADEHWRICRPDFAWIEITVAGSQTPDATAFVIGQYLASLTSMSFNATSACDDDDAARRSIFDTLRLTSAHHAATWIRSGIST